MQPVMKIWKGTNKTKLFLQRLYKLNKTKAVKLHKEHTPSFFSVLKPGKKKKKGPRLQNLENKHSTRI